MTILKGTELQPAALWKHFAAICAIPHPSGHEEKLIEYTLNFCRKLNLDAVTDDVGNIFIRKPASSSASTAQTTLLQAHLDMVPQADEHKQYDFTKEPVIPIIDDDGWIRADKTTLGADNGIALAAIFAILEDDTLEHGPLNVLLTVEEETRMLGANMVSPDFFEGDVMINLDAEDIDEIYIACAGGCETSGAFRLLYSPLTPSEYRFFKLSVGGCEGGHSGVDIILKRGNAIKILGTALDELNRKYEISLFNLQGGSLWNAIPREAYAQFALPVNNDPFCEFRRLEEKLKSEYRETDPGLTIELSDSPAVDNVFENDCNRRILKSLMLHPDGVFAMSGDLDGVVETSSNLGIMKTENDTFTLASMQRSLIDSERDRAQKKVADIMESLDFEISFGESFPCWTPRPETALVRKCTDVYRRILGREPRITAIHAGLECGIIGKKKPSMEMIAIGPTIKFPHSPGEKVNIESVEKFMALLKGLIEVV